MVVDVIPALSECRGRPISEATQVCISIHLPSLSDTDALTHACMHACTRAHTHMQAEGCSLVTEDLHTMHETRVDPWYQKKKKPHKNTKRKEHTSLPML